MSGVALRLNHPPVEITPIDLSQIKPRWFFDTDDVEQVTRLASVLTIHPLKSLASYFFPFFGAITDSYYKVYRDDIAQKARIPEQTKTNLFREVDVLKGHVGIGREVDVYTGLVRDFHCYGGKTLSATSPLFVMPQHRLIRPDAPDFGAEVPERDKLKDDPWLFSDDETRFFIARELCHIKHNDALLRIAAKIGILVSAFFMYFGPVGIMAGIAIAVAAVVLFIISERCFQWKMDMEGVKVMAKKFDAEAKLPDQELAPEAKIENEIRATDIAIHVFKKIQQQNAARWKASYFARMYMKKDGGKNFFDITNPFLDARIARLEKHRVKLIESIPLPL